MAQAKFNKIFKEVNETQKRYRVLMGSAGSGKSVNIAQDYIIKLSDPKYKGCSLLVVRASEASHLNSTYAELYGAIVRLGLESLWTLRTNPMQMINIATGNHILFRGCNDLRALERLKSVTVPNGKLCWVWIEEATELKANVLKLKQPGIGDYRDINPVFERNFIMNNKEERLQATNEINYGLISPVEYRMRFFNESLEEAEKNLPKRPIYDDGGEL